MITPPNEGFDESKSAHNAMNIQLFLGQDPMSHLMHRSFHEHPQRVIYASGSYFTLEDLHKVLDGCGGAANVAIGAHHPSVLKAINDQHRAVSYVYTGSYTTDIAEELASMVLTTLPAKQHGLTKMYLCQGGSESTDTAMKLAKQYHWERGDHERTHYVSRLQSYHGSSIAAMSLSSNLARKVPYAGILFSNVSFVSPAFAYHYQDVGETDQQYVDRLIAELDTHFQEIGPQRIISFSAETVTGATSGSVTAPKGYFVGVRALCDKYGILLHLDEVMCGLGRTGTYFAFEQENVLPDIVTVGKGLGAGYEPVAGVLFNNKIETAIKNGTGSFNHGFTYQNHAAGCAAALAVQRVIHAENLVARVARLSGVLRSWLVEAFGANQYVGDIRGRGFLQTIEFVIDKSTKESFPPAMKFGQRVQRRAHEYGLDVYLGMGTVDGYKGDHIIIAPAFNIDEVDLKRIVDILKRAVDFEVGLL